MPEVKIKLALLVEELLDLYCDLEVRKFALVEMLLKLGKLYFVRLLYQRNGFL